MIDHFGIIVKDIEASKAFYEAVLAPLGYAKTIDESYGVGFSNPDRTQHTGIFWLGQGEPSSPLHFAFAAPSRAAVDAFYAAGLAAGAQDNGAPGVRAIYHPDYYGAFLLSTQTGITLRQCVTLLHRGSPTLLVGDGVPMRRSFSR